MSSHWFPAPSRREIRAMKATRLGRLWFWIWYGN